MGIKKKYKLEKKKKKKFIFIDTINRINLLFVSKFLRKKLWIDKKKKQILRIKLYKYRY